MFRQSVIIFGMVFSLGIQPTQAFVHPGCMSTRVDLVRMKAKVAAEEEPWKTSWGMLVANNHAQLSRNHNSQEYVCAGGVCHLENFMPLVRDCAVVYQCVLRYHISGNTLYADPCVSDTNLVAETTYYYVVTALNPAGKSDRSNEVKVGVLGHR